MLPSSLQTTTSTKFISPLLPAPSATSVPSSLSENLLAQLAQTHDQYQSDYAFGQLLMSFTPGREPSIFVTPPQSDGSKLIVDCSREGEITILPLAPDKNAEPCIFTPMHPAWEMITAIPQNLPLIAEWREWANTPTQTPELRQEAMVEMLECLVAKDNTLTLNNKNLTTLPAHLPPSVRVLEVCHNQLTALPELPENMLKIDASHNKLSRLPHLPLSLRTLNVSVNKLTTLPELPPNLNFIYADNNCLSRLPPLPPDADSINVSDNYLTELPALPEKLYALRVNNNQLTSLPVLPKNLHVLNASNNNLTWLPDLMAGPRDLFIEHNQITVLPAVCRDMETLNVSYNPMTTFPSLPSGLLLTISREQIPYINKSSGINLVARDEGPQIVPHTGELMFILN